MDNNQDEWYITAPWNPVTIRRGDALGFRAGADHLAELLAPGLSNLTVDARWISVLSWCLKWANIAWQKASLDESSYRPQELYDWLRPLELLWVARTREFEKNSNQVHGKRQLRGINSINRWLDNDCKDSGFSMSSDQFKGYRQTGMYGAYRVIFRKTKLATNDGWKLGKEALGLADMVNNSLGDAKLEENVFDGTKWSYWRANEARFWLKKGWRNWNKQSNRGLLPTPADANKLRRTEIKLLAPILFKSGSIRRLAVDTLSKAKKKATYHELCEILSKSLSDKPDMKALVVLPKFSRFADAAMDVMRRLWKIVQPDTSSHQMSIKKAAESMDNSLLEQIVKEAGEWLKLSIELRSYFPHQQIVTELAQAMVNAKASVDKVELIAKHHVKYGGGKRWFNLQGDKLIPVLTVSDIRIVSTNYRFRLRTLCRLAAQLEVADLGHILNTIDKHDSSVEDVDE